MNTATYDHRFPTLKAIAALTLSGATTAALLIMAVWHFQPDQPDAASAAKLMALASIFAAWLGLLPVILLGHLGVMATVYSYFIGAAIRVVLCLSAGVAAVVVGKLPAATVGLTLIAMYLPLLFVEVGFVARFLWMKDFTYPALAPSTNPLSAPETSHTKVSA